MNEMICYFVGAGFVVVVVAGADVQYGLFVESDVDRPLEVMDRRICFVLDYTACDSGNGIQ